MYTSPGKYDQLLSTKSHEVASINGMQITFSTVEILFGINIDSELNFENDLSAMCNKVSRKINALRWIANYMPLEKRRIVMKTFIESHFYYCYWFGCLILKPSTQKSTAYMKEP